MNNKINKKELLVTVLFLGAMLILVLAVVVIDEKLHPRFSAEIAGKEATVSSDVARICYDSPFSWREIGTVTKSQRVKLTGKMAYLKQTDIVKMEIELDNRLAWISKKDITILE